MEASKGAGDVDNGDNVPGDNGDCTAGDAAIADEATGTGAEATAETGVAGDVAAAKDAAAEPTADEATVAEAAAARGTVGSCNHKSAAPAVASNARDDATADRGTKGVLVPMFRNWLGDAAAADAAAPAEYCDDCGGYGRACGSHDGRADDDVDGDADVGYVSNSAHDAAGSARRRRAARSLSSWR